MGRRICALVVGLMMVAGACRAQDAAPTDTDLKASYCAGVMAQQKKDFKEIVPDVETNAALPDIVKKNWSSINDKGQHLAQYLGIRFGYIDPTGSAVAMMRGAQDMEKMRTPELRQCTDKCMATALKVPQEQFTSCMRACDPETLPRIWSCNNLSWLPF